MKNIRETVSLENWKEDDWKTEGTETRIMNRLEIKVKNTHRIGKEHDAGKARAEERYRNPPEGFIKLNFDGAAKGNPGEAGIGGIFRDEEGKIKWAYAMECCIAMNNEAEYHALNRGLEIAIREGYHSLQIEGDSMLVIEIMKQLQQGTTTEKLRKSWRTAWVITELHQQLQKMSYPPSSTPFHFCPHSSWVCLFSALFRHLIHLCPFLRPLLLWV